MELRSSSSSLYGDRDGDRGAGGKLGKPHVRKRPATPYDRPPVNLATRGTGSWWSKLSDPAYRLVSGATKLIFSSFHTNSPTNLPFAETESELEDKLDVEVIPNAKGDDPCTSSYDVPKFSERTEPSQVASDKLKIAYESEGCGQDRPNNLSDDSQLSRIEQLITGKKFSRDEINRLMEILNSGVGNLSDVDGEKKNELTTNPGHSAGVKRTPFPGISDERNQEDMSRAIVRTPRMLLYSNVNMQAQDDVGASPIDIAKAYMGSRALETGHGSQNASPNDEITAQSNDKFVIKPFTPSYSHKSSTCWPGAMVQDKRSYITPYQRSRYGLHDFPRTPYSRTIYSKSRSKLNQLQADGSQTTSSKAFPQLRTPIFGQVKSRNDVHDDSYGSVGPVRGIRNEFSSEARTRGSILLNASKDAASPFQWPGASESYTPTVENNIEQGETSEQWRGDYSGNRFKEPAPLLNPSPSQAVKKILEQLDRSKPTPKEKVAELNLAMSWRKSPPEVSDAVQKNVSFLDSEKFGPLKNTDSCEPRLLSQGNQNDGNSTRLTRLQKRSTEAEDGVVTSSKSSGMFIGNSGTTNGVNAGSFSPQMKRFQQEGSLGIKNVANEIGLNSSLHLQSNGQQASTVSSEFLELSKKAQQSSGTKPVLPHISVGRRDPKRAVVSDNGAGFTFPVTSSSSVFSEPPTPSFLPVSSGSTVSDSKEVPTVTSFSFGTEKSAPRLVFSFPSTGSATNHVDSVDPKFNFGSGKKPRLSFDSVGKDAICY